MFSIKILIRLFFLGHYVPQLATLILQYNKQPNVKPIKLKSIAVMTE